MSTALRSSVGGKRALEPESTHATHHAQDAPAQRPAKRAKGNVGFNSEVRTADGPDLISRITSDLIDDTIKSRIYDLESLQTSIRTSVQSAHFIFDAVYKDLLASEEGCVLVQSLILSVVYKRLQALVNTITTRATEDGKGMLTLLPSHTRIGNTFIPVLVKLQGAIHMIILDRCKPSPDEPPANHATAITTYATHATATITHANSPPTNSETYPFNTATSESAKCSNMNTRHVRLSCSKASCAALDEPTTSRRPSVI